MAQAGQRGPGPGPGPGQQGYQLPIRPQSSRIVDLAPMNPIPMDEAACLKRLTNYSAYSLRKATPYNPKDKPTWARSEVQDEKLAQEDIIKQIKKLNEKGKPIAEKKLALAPNQGSQVTNLLDDIIAREHDRNFEWTLAQLERKERVLKNGLRETLTMTVYFKRAPLKELSAVVLYQNIERNRHERMMQQQRQQQEQQQRQQQEQQQRQQQEQQQRQQQEQQQRQQQQQQQRPPVPPNHERGQSRARSQGPPPQIFKIDRKASKSRLPTPKKDGSRPPVVKKYHSDTSSVGPYDSDYSGSDYSGSSRTSLSSLSRDGRKHSKSGRKRTQSYTRRREHRKDYHVDLHGFSPERPGMQHRYSVPDVPRNGPGFDPFAAAYQAGKLDADTERFELDRLERERELLDIERERAMLERERLTAPRPLMIERPVIVDRPVSMVERPIHLDRREPPRAIVSYGRAPPLPARVYSDGGRYDERYVDDLRSPPLRGDDEFFGRAERDAEEYIEIRRRPADIRRGSEPRVSVYHNSHHPFAPISLPRRYAPSNDSWP